MTSSVPSPVDSPSPMTRDDSSSSVSTADSSSDESSQSTFSSSSNQRNGPCKRIAVRKLKRSRRLSKSRSSKTKLLYNHYVCPGDCWTFLGLSDPSNVSLDFPLPSPSSVTINQFQVPPSYDIMGSKDPFDLLDFDVSTTGDDCSSSCVYSIDADFSSVSIVHYANTGTRKVTPSLSTNTPAGRVPPSPSILLS